MQEITCFLSQPQKPFANLKWQPHAGASADLNSEAVVHSLLYPHPIEACLPDKVPERHLKELVTLQKPGAGTLLCPEPCTHIYNIGDDFFLSGSKNITCLCL